MADLTVLQSFWEPRPTSNPYVAMLLRSLQELPGVTVLTFSWRAALLRNYSVFHVHWPETLLGGRTPTRRLARQLLVLALLVRLRVARIPIVRTVHNVNPPDVPTRRDRFLLRALERETTLRIRLNESTDLTGLGEFETIVLGHYIDWYDQRVRHPVVPGQIGYFGLIRRYKGVESLIAAFRETDAPGLTLRVAGSPSTRELAGALEALAADDERVGLTLRFLDDDELVELATSSELVVLPYRFMHNSAGLLTALSLQRPVLVPDNDVNRRLAAEVGPGWIYLFSSTELTATDLEESLQLVRSAPPGDAPNLSARDWDAVGGRHVETYKRALSLGRDRRRRQSHIGR
jgi:glycosyltransferase involved in cell wall biosynthesis